MTDHTTIAEMQAGKTGSDKIVLAVLCGLTGLASAVLTEKGYFAGKAAFVNFRNNKTNN